MASNVAIRLGLEGGAEIKRGLDDVAKSGQAAFDGMAAAADRAGTASDRTMERWKRMAAAAREAQAADQSQAGINRLLGVTEAPNQSASRERLRDLEAAFAPIPRRAAEVAAANDNITKSIGLQRHEWTNLTRQVGDAVTMLAMGATPLQVIISQGDQVRDVLQNSQGGVKGALKEIGSTMLGLLTPARVVFGGIIGLTVGAAAATASYIAQQKELEQRLNGVGRASGMTVGGVNRIAEARSGAAGISVGDARDALATFGATGRIGEQIGGDLLPVGARLSRMLGVDLTEANTMLAKAFADPVKGAEQLSDRLGNLNDSTRRTIELQVLSGDRLGAQKTLMDSVSASIAGSTEKLSLWTEAWIKAKGVLDGVGAATKSVIDPSLEEQISAAQKRLDDLTIRRNDPNRPGNRGGFGIPLDIPQGEDPAVPALRERLKQLQEELSWRTINDNAAMDAAQERQRSTDVGGRVNPYLAEQDAIAKLRAERDALARDLQNPPQDIAPDRIKRAWEVANGAVTTYLDSEDRRQKANDLAIRSINARTDSERAALAVEQMRLDLAGKKVDIDRQQAEIDARREALARSTRAAEDRLRSSADSLGLAGRLPYDRAREEIEQRYRRQNEENAGNQEALRRNAAARANDLRALNIEQIQGPLRSTTLSINEQIAGLRVFRDSIGATDQAAAEMAAKQELLNAATRAGIPLTKDYVAELDGLAKKLGEVRVAQEEANRTRQSIQGGLDDLRGGSTGLLSGALTDIRNRRDPLQGILNNFGRMTDQFIERTVLRPAVEGILGKFGSTQDGIFKGGLATLFADPSKLAVPQPINTPLATIQAGTVVIGGAGLGSIPGLGAGAGGSGAGSISLPSVIPGPGLGTGAGGSGSAAIVIPPSGVGPAGLGFGPGGAKESGSAAALGSGLSFGFGGLGSPAAAGGDAARFLASFLVPGRSAASIDGLTTTFAERLATAMRAAPAAVQQSTFIASAFRSPERQAELWSAALAKYGSPEAARKWVAPPNSSLHNSGQAVDFSYKTDEARNWWHQNAESYGLKFPMRHEPWHIEPSETRGGPAFGKQSSLDFDAASKSFSQSTDLASKSVADLGQSVGNLPDAASSATSSLASLASSLFNIKPDMGLGGGSFSLAGGLGGSSGGAGISTGGEAWFADGGYTGPGGKYEPRGTVHAGEVVFSQNDVARHGGPAAVDAMRKGLPSTMRDARPRTAPATSVSAPVSYAPTYNVNPAEGVTPEQLGRVIETNNRKFLADLKRNWGAIGTESYEQFG